MLDLSYLEILDRKEPFKMSGNVGSIFHQDGTSAFDPGVIAAEPLTIGTAWEGEEFPLLVKGSFHGEDGAALLRGFNEDGAEGHAADDPVALWKILAVWGRQHGKFANEAALLRDPICQSVVFWRIDVAEARTDDCD